MKLKNNLNLTVNDLAVYLVDKKIINSPLLLQKILFFVRYEELKKEKNGEKQETVFNINDKFEAWINGPVHRDIYFGFRNFFNFDDEKDVFKIDENKSKILSKRYDFFIDKYLNIYNKNGIWKLVELTHKNIAWIKARKGIDKNEPSTNKLDDNLIPENEPGFEEILNNFK
ncbi:MAG: hypothetical protein HPAVJP_0840 [Candidatus Hepatoplasma vulgare]|nr:MAG: hypothetical protein HPAVJP_0840 [Candidatus Hepatoplasma sp.]